MKTGKTGALVIFCTRQRGQHLGTHQAGGYLQGSASTIRPTPLDGHIRKAISAPAASLHPISDSLLSLRPFRQPVPTLRDLLSFPHLLLPPQLIPAHIEYRPMQREFPVRCGWGRSGDGNGCGDRWGGRFE